MSPSWGQVNGCGATQKHLEFNVGLNVFVFMLVLYVCLLDGFLRWCCHVVQLFKKMCGWLLVYIVDCVV